MIRQHRAEYAPVEVGKALHAAGAGRLTGRRGGISGDSSALRKENERLARQVARLQETLERREETLRILEDLATELKKDMAKSHAK